MLRILNTPQIIEDENCITTLAGFVNTFGKTLTAEHR
jgi:hypothetical protein